MHALKQQQNVLGIGPLAWVDNAKPGMSEQRRINIHWFANEVDRCNEIDWFGVSVHIFRKIYVLTSRVIRLALIVVIAFYPSPTQLLRHSWPHRHSA